MAFIPTGITRPLDTLGRVVLPKELRESHVIAVSDRLEFHVCTEDPDLIVIKKVQDCCTLCGNKTNLIFGKFGVGNKSTHKCICTNCLKRLQQIDLHTESVP